MPHPAAVMTSKPAGEPARHLERTDGQHLDADTSSSRQLSTADVLKHNEEVQRRDAELRRRMGAANNENGGSRSPDEALVAGNGHRGWCSFCRAKTWHDLTKNPMFFGASIFTCETCTQLTRRCKHFASCKAMALCGPFMNDTFCFYCGGDGKQNTSFYHFTTKAADQEHALARWCPFCLKHQAQILSKTAYLGRDLLLPRL